MTILEMFIEARLSSQNVASNIKRKLLDEEIAWLLNKMQQRFIQSKVKSRKDGSGGFELDQVDVDAVRTLLRDKELIAERTQQGYRAYLPADYSYLISDDSRVTNLCGIAPTAAPTTTENVLSIPIALSALNAPAYYANVVMTIGSNSFTFATLSTLYQGNYTGLQSKGEIYTVVDVILNYVRDKLGIDIYWERYRGLYYPHTFLLPGQSAGSITIDGANTVNGTVVTQMYSAYTSTSGVWTSNRLSNSKNISLMLSTPYQKSSYLSPISELEGNYLNIYGDIGFTVNKVSVYYVKKPRRMSLILGQDCELPEEFHMSICDLLVEYFKGETADPNWDVKMKDNMLRNPVI